MTALPHIVIVGCSVAGYTAAVRLADALQTRRPHEARARITVVSRSDRLLFSPALIWVPFGLRRMEAIRFPLGEPLEKTGVRLLVASAERIDLARCEVITSAETLRFDHLLVATGPKPHPAAIAGMDDGECAGGLHCIVSAEGAVETGRAWQRLIRDPGPVVVGAVQGASCFSAAYEFALNLAHRVRRLGLQHLVPITFITAEPRIGYFNTAISGEDDARTARLLERLGIRHLANQSVDRVEPGAVRLRGGERLPFRFAMLVPPFIGDEVVSCSPGLGDARAFVPVTGEYRHPDHPQVFAAGAAIVPPAPPTPVPCGMPKTGYMSEETAKVAAHNIAARILGGSPRALSFPDLDARWAVEAERVSQAASSIRPLEPHDATWLVPGAEAQWARVAFERYSLAKRGRAFV